MAKTMTRMQMRHWFSGRITFMVRKAAVQDLLQGNAVPHKRKRRELVAGIATTWRGRSSKTGFRAKPNYDLRKRPR